MEHLTSEILNKPGLFTAMELRRAASELLDFLKLFQEVQSIVGAGMVIEGILSTHINTLIKTAEIVDQR